MQLDPKQWGPFYFGTLFMALFAYTVIVGHENNTLENIALVIAGFWFGSSLGSLKKTDATIEKDKKAP